MKNRKIKTLALTIRNIMSKLLSATIQKFSDLIKANGRSRGEWSGKMMNKTVWAIGIAGRGSRGQEVGGNKKEKFEGS